EDVGGLRLRDDRDHLHRVRHAVRLAPRVPLRRRRDRAGGGARGRGSGRRPLRVDAEAGRGREGHRPPARRSRGDARPPRRAALRGPGRVLHDPRAHVTKRVAVLGATGSIGRQAIEVIEANPELELVAATSGSSPIDGLAPMTQTGGDPTELLERARPDVVLNAVVGFAGLAPTMWALERGVTLALAARRRGNGAIIPVDSEHSALFQCAQLGIPESVVLTASGGPFRGRTR